MCAAAMVSRPVTAGQPGDTPAPPTAAGWSRPAPGGYDALPAPGLTAVTVKIDLAAFAQV